ncbi:MAG: NUDIX domain-containing protein [Bacteroidales bacterium]|nr:NUDIX domain-containing protein [Bacteroidales bacterium]
MPLKSAGIVAYRKLNGSIEYFLVHNAGPYWEHKDLDAWSIPKGLFEEEKPLDAAIREFNEETGQEIAGDFFELTPVKQPSGKVIYPFAVEANPDADKVVSNLFEMEWPPRSGQIQEFPEVDKGGWFAIDMAKKKIMKGQIPILEELSEILRSK